MTLRFLAVAVLLLSPARTALAQEQPPQRAIRDATLVAGPGDPTRGPFDLVIKTAAIRGIVSRAADGGLEMVPRHRDDSAGGDRVSPRIHAHGVFPFSGVQTPDEARAREPEKQRGGEWYVQWGYNTEQYASTNIRFSQPAQGNDFTLHGVAMHDNKGWDIWNHAPSVPQYSIRIGKFIRPNTAIEINFDHAKAIVVPDQSVRITGTLDGRPVDETVTASDVVDPYMLNNGANFFLVNAVQRFPLVGNVGDAGSIAALAKAGLGFMIPHPQNTVFGEPNDPGFQYGGLGAGLEGAIRLRVQKYVFVEVSQKVFYGRYRSLEIAGGKAQHDLWAHVTVLSLGVTW